MPKIEALSEEALTEAIKSLEDLAQAEYGMSLEQLLVDDDPVPGKEYQNMKVRDSHDAVWRVGRLIGITVKEPFAKEPHEPPDGWVSQTGARRGWDLNDDVLGIEHPDWWQYNLVTELLGREESREDFDWLPPQNLPQAEQVQQFLEAAHGERGVFRAIVTGARRFLCSKPELEAAVASARERTTATGRIKADPVQMIAQGGFQQVAAVIISNVPWLTVTMAPVITGLLLLMAAYGVNSLCERTPPEPLTGIVET